MGVPQGRVPCGLKVYDHLELGRNLDRKFARLRATEKAIEVGCGAAKNVHPVDSVGKQTAFSSPDGLRVDRWHLVSGCQQYGRRAMDPRKSVRQDDKAALRLAPSQGYDRFDFGVATNGRRDRLDLERS